LLLVGSRRIEARPGLLAQDFQRAFVAIGLISLASLVWYRALAADAGAELSGHEAEPARPDPD